MVGNRKIRKAKLKDAYNPFPYFRAKILRWHSVPELLLILLVLAVYEELPGQKEGIQGEVLAALKDP